MTSAPIAGVMPVAPTVFRDDEDLDLAGQARVMDFLVDSGASAICVLANFSEQFSLTDDERVAVLERSLDAVAGRLPVCVTTSHFSALVAAARSRGAQERGAAMVMLMPPFFGATIECDEAQVYEWFARVVDGLDIDVMIQDAPLSTTRMSAELIARLANTLPQIRYAKIEVARAATKIARIATLAEPGSGLRLFDGEESVTLIPDLDAGAVGTMCSALAPDLIAPICADHAAGRTDAAADRWMRLLPLLQYENRQLGPAAAKVALAEGGIIASDRMRAPIYAPSAATRAALVDHLRQRDALVLSWAAS